MLPIEIESRLGEIKSLIEGLGAELIDISLRRSSGRSSLVVLADKPGGITLDECARINSVLGTFLDEAGFATNPYLLEVSSPGLDRPLKTEKDFSRVLGENVRVVALNPDKKTVIYTGRVLSVNDGILELNAGQNGQAARVPLETIVRAAREIKI